LLGTSRSREQRRTLRPPAAVHRLSLEALEDRLSPAILTVNSTADTANPSDPYLTLREAIAIVNSPTLHDGLSGQILGQINGTLHGGGADTILFDTTAVTDPISLTNGELELSLPASTAAITIDGSDVVAVDGANAHRVFHIDPGVQATFAHLGIVRGYASGSGEASLGGGIYSRGLLTLTDCNLDANTCAGGVGGGLCNNGGTVTIDGSAVTNCAAVDGNGGGLYNSADGTLTVTDSLVRGNSCQAYGGGIYNAGGRLMVRGSTLGNNSVNAEASGLGGGIYNTGSGTAAVTDSALSGNFAQYGGGLANDSGTLTMASSSLSANSVGMFGEGGGIYNIQGTLTVAGSRISGNSANFGGGIYCASSTLTVIGCDLHANSAAIGGGIYSGSGTLTVTGSTLSANSAGTGGGIDSADSTLTVTDCDLHANSAGNGGGIFKSFGGTVMVTGSTLRANNSTAGGGGIYVLGTLTVTDSTLGANSARVGGGIFSASSTLTVIGCDLSTNSADNGGGIYNYIGGTLTVSGTTLGANSASLGGGIYNEYGTLTVTNCTFNGNSASSSGGGIYNAVDSVYGGALTVTSCTLSGNSASSSGGGIYSEARGTLLYSLGLGNTILAGNSSPDGPDINASVQASSRYNLVGNGDGTLTGISNGSQGNQIGTPASPIDPGLLPLGDYGGPTYTMALLPGSPALDAGDPAQAGSPDQRGVTRSGGVNIGAFQASAVLLVVYAPTSVTAGVPFDIRVAAFDPYGLTDFGYSGTVTLSSSDPQVGLIGSHSYTLADAGSFTFSAVELTPGAQTLTASDGTLTTTFDLTVLPGAAPSHGSGPAASLRLGQSSGLLLGYDGLDSLTTASLATVLVRQPDGLGPIP
jgi:hypothetical protein